MFIVQYGGIEDAVQINVHEIEKIGFIPAGHGIHGLVAEGHGVEKGIDGILQQFSKRFFDLIPLRAPKNAVLQDMEDTGVIFRQGLEGDTEGLVLLLAFQPNQLGAAFFVGEFMQDRPEFGQLSDTVKGKAVPWLICCHFVFSAFRTAGIQPGLCGRAYTNAGPDPSCPGFP